MRKYAVLPTEKKLETLGRRLHELKALQPVTLNVAGRNSWTEALVIVGASSVRHAQGLADGVLAWCREENVELLSMEGYRTGQWILVDLNDVVVHIFQTPTRELYRLESLWGESPKPAPQKVSA